MSAQPGEDRARPGRLEVTQALRPDGTRGSLWFPRQLVDHLYKTNPFVYRNIRTAVETLKAPSKIWSGTRVLEDDKGGWCYTARPQYIRDREGRPLKLWEGHVFCVYVNSRMEAYNWRTERQDPKDPDKPLDERGGRFDKQAWQKH